MGITPKNRDDIPRDDPREKVKCLARCVGLLANTEPLLVEATVELLDTDRNITNFKQCSVRECTTPIRSG